MADVEKTVEIAWNAGYTTAAASRTWTDITGYVEPGGVDIQRGRQNEQSDVSPSTCGLTLDNRDGRFTPEYAGGAYYPNVKKGRPIRIRTGVPDSTIAVDHFNGADSTVGVWDGPSGPGSTTSVGGLVWAGDSADWGMLTSRAYKPTSSTSNVTLDAGVADVTVSCNFTTGAVLNGSGLVLRYTDANNFVRLTADSSLRWTFTKVVGGVASSLAFVSGPVASTTYALEIVLSGSSLALYVGGVLTLSSSTALDAILLSGTRFGLRSAGTTDHFWDAFTIIGTVYTTRFLGYVDEWPVEWPGGSDAMATASIKATSRMARLSLGLPYRSIVEEEILDDDPVLYWPLGEPEGATEAGNIAPGRTERLVVTQLGTGGTLTFGAGTGPGTDDLTAPVFTPASTSNGLYLDAVLLAPVNASSDTIIEVEAFVNTTGSNIGILNLTAADSTYLHLLLSTGAPVVVMAQPGFSATALSATTVNDGATHHIAGRIVLSGGNITASIVVDGGTRTTGGSVAWTGSLPSFTQVLVGRSLNVLDLYVGTLSHVAIRSGTVAVSDARIGQHSSAGLTGFSGEASGARITRYARMAGIPTAEISTETGLSTSIAHKDTTGQSAIQMMQDVAHTEDGVVFDGKDGTLTFHARDHRYAATSAFTLSCADGEVEPNLAPVLDDQGMLNDVTASREDGATARSVNQTSIDEYGVYRDSVELMTTSDNEVQSRADWEVNRRATPRVKLTAVTVDVMVASDAQAALILAADIGTKFTVDDLPAQAPATSMDFFVEGITYDIADDRFVVTFNTSAAILSTVWILDSATLSQLDSTTVLAY